LGEKKSTAAIPILSQLLGEDEDEIVRNNAAIALAEIGIPKEIFNQLTYTILTSRKFEDLTKKIVGRALSAELLSTSTQIWQNVKREDSIQIIHTLMVCLPYIFPYLYETLTNNKEQIRNNAWEIFKELYYEFIRSDLMSIADLLSILQQSIEPKFHV